MNVIETCKDIRQRIETLNSVRRKFKDAEVFRERAKEIVEFRKSVTDLLQKIDVLRENDITLSKLPSFTSSQSSLDAYRQKLHDDLADSGKEYGLLKRSLNGLAKQLEMVYQKAIETIKRDIPTINEVYLKQVERIPGHSDQVARIRAERDSLLSGQDPETLNADKLRGFLAKRDAIKKLADALEVDQFPKEVLEFFRAARQVGGAPREKLTEAVEGWLRERNLLKNVRVMIVDK
jgi:hypothetical protein